MRYISVFPNCDPAIHNFSRGNINIYPISPIPHEFIRGYTNPDRKFFLTHDFSRGNYPEVIQLCHMLS